MEDEGVGQGVGGVGAGGAEAGAVDLGHDVGGFVADGFGVAEVLVGAVVGPVREGVFYLGVSGGTVGTHAAGATSRTQCPKEPKVTEEWRMSEALDSMTFRMAMSPMTGAEMVVMSRRIAAAKRRKTPKLKEVLLVGRFCARWVTRVNSLVNAAKHVGGVVVFGLIAVVERG